MKSYYRKLEVATAGRWYIALTIFLGVIALTTGNNILCLLESVLLAALVVIGMISEHILRSTEVFIIRGEASANSTINDYLRIKNISRLPIFCFEIGEWRKKEFIPLGFVTFLKGHEEILIPSIQKVESRGVHKWDGLVIATSFPTGFTTKYRYFESHGERIVWPEKEQKSKFANDQCSPESLKQRIDYSITNNEINEGEIRPINFDDDLKWIVWTVSQKGQGLFVRNHQTYRKSREVELVLKDLSPSTIETEVVRAAAPFYTSSEEGQPSSLSVIKKKGKIKLQGRKNILNFLATLELEENTN